MNFFDGPAAGSPPPEASADALALAAYEPCGNEDFAPAHWFVPAQVRQVEEIGAGPDVRIMLTGWEVWPGSVTLRLGVFRRRIRPQGEAEDDDPSRPGGLRVGVQLADGRKATTLDAEEWTADGPARPTLRLTGGEGGAFHYQLQLHLSQLPPEGRTRLVVAWPDEQVPETHTAVDAAALRAAAGEALEIWPDAGPPAPPSGGEEEQSFVFASFGPYEIMAQPPETDPDEEWRPPAPDRSRRDWEGMTHDGWKDAELVRARLANGADPDSTDPEEEETPLHRAAATGSPEAVTQLIARARDVDARDGEGCTPLWHAVCHGARANAELLLAAGADAWSPQLGGRSPGRLALTTAMAPLFAGLPGAVPLTAEERAAQQEADERTAVFAGVHTEGVSIAFVAGIDEDEAVRRLGGDPCTCPSDEADEDDEEDDDYDDPDDLPYGLDPWDFEDPERHVGVTGVPGGCVLIQPTSYELSTGSVLGALSLGTTAYGLYFNPKGGTFGTLSRDGRTELSEEIGRPVHGDGSSEDHWLYRFWNWDVPDGMWGAGMIAYASAQAGLRVTDAGPVDGPPRRWVEIPEGSPLLD
ncbi:ankyrin repeat domain-containing protein [Streptomyces chattanoogensis]|uniref:ankyrin repeat domain-containing protein n=1 Tax=Streptomyces chattanoogensis TaxID=66876 RepID=UPI0036C4CA40